MIHMYAIMFGGLNIQKPQIWYEHILPRVMIRGHGEFACELCWMFLAVKRGCFDPRIRGLTSDILFYLYAEFQCFSVCGSSHQSLQSQ